MIHPFRLKSVRVQDKFPWITSEWQTMSVLPDAVYPELFAIAQAVRHMDPGLLRTVKYLASTQYYTAYRKTVKLPTPKSYKDGEYCQRTEVRVEPSDSLFGYERILWISPSHNYVTAELNPDTNNAETFILAHSGKILTLNCNQLEYLTGVPYQLDMRMQRLIEYRKDDPGLSFIPYKEPKEGL